MAGLDGEIIAVVCAFLRYSLYLQIKLIATLQRPSKAIYN